MGTGPGTQGPKGGISIFTVPWGIELQIQHQPIVVTIPDGCDATVEQRDGHTVIKIQHREVLVVRGEAIDNGVVRIDGPTP